MISPEAAIGIAEILKHGGDHEDGWRREECDQYHAETITWLAEAVRDSGMPSADAERVVEGVRMYFKEYGKDIWDENFNDCSSEHKCRRGIWTILARTRAFTRTASGVFEMHSNMCIGNGICLHCTKCANSVLKGACLGMRTNGVGACV